MLIDELTYFFYYVEDLNAQKTKESTYEKD